MTARYKYWPLLDELPPGWWIDKHVGSPLHGYEFCINGSILKGGRRALVRTQHAPRDMSTPVKMDAQECASAAEDDPMVVTPTRAH